MPARPGDIVLITIDTLRVDHLGIYGYRRSTSPNIDRWFSKGAIFERAYSTEASTSPSVVSILSGTLPQEHGVRLFFQHVPTDVKLLPDLLPDEYQSAAIVSNMVLTDEAMGMASYFDHYDDFVDQRESVRKIFERNAKGTTDAALRWLATQRDPDRPAFLWVHYIDPHGPYKPPSDWKTEFGHEGSVPVIVEKIHPYALLEGVDDALTYVDRYDAEINYCDHQVDRLLKAYAKTQPIDDALVLLTSDHGESMMDHERWFAHTYHVYEELVHVPLLLRGPGVEPIRTQRLASLIDVATTILGFAGAEIPSGLQGFDLRRGSTLTLDRTVFAEASRMDGQWRAAIRGDKKWITLVRGRRREIFERVLYDLAADPEEATKAPWPEMPAQGSPSAVLEEMVRTDPDPSGWPRAFVRGTRLDAPKAAPGLTDEQFEILKSLGYTK